MIGPIQFVNNKYLIWYLKICNLARSRCLEFGEDHHVIPKSFGGTNGKNLVRLTAREHFLCHWLLTKFTLGPEKRKMCYALNFMTRGTANHASRIKSSWRIALAKKAQREAMLGNKTTLGQKRDEAFRQRRREIMLGNTNSRGFKVSAETKAKISASLIGNNWNIGKKASAAARAAMSVSQSGRKHSLETKLKMSASAQGLKKKENSSSEFSGVCWSSNKRKWQSQFKVGGARYVGSFANEIDAAIFYNVHASLQPGEFARFNVIPSGVWAHE